MLFHFAVNSVMIRTESNLFSSRTTASSDLLINIHCMDKGVDELTHYTLVPSMEKRRIITHLFSKLFSNISFYLNSLLSIIFPILPPYFFPSVISFFLFYVFSLLTSHSLSLSHFLPPFFSPFYPDNSSPPIIPTK